MSGSTTIARIELIYSFPSSENLFCYLGRLYGGTCVVPRVKLRLTLLEEYAELGEETMQLRTSGMTEDDASSKENARILHQLLEAIESVRIKRQEAYRDRPH